MTQDPTLSGEEISALMSEPEAARAGGASGPARPFAFGAEAPRTMSAIPAIDRLGERMVKRLRDVIEPFARVKPKVATEPCSVRAFADWQAEQDEFTSLSLYAFRPMKGRSSSSSPLNIQAHPSSSGVDRWASLKAKRLESKSAPSNNSPASIRSM